MFKLKGENGMAEETTNKQRRTQIMLSLNDKELGVVDAHMKINNFYKRATFVKWVLSMFLTRRDDGK
jgi:hypothetical protein